MSYESKIQMYGYRTELLIGSILKNQMDEILEFCKANDRNLKRVWYFSEGDDRDFMQKALGMKDGWHWYKMGNITRANGFTFVDKSQIQEFFDGRFTRPKLTGIYHNGEKVEFDYSKLKCHYDDPVQLPQLKENEFFVYHGLVDRLNVTYHFKTEEEVFDESNLEFHFTDLGEYGYMLTGLHYCGQKAKQSLSGSTGVQTMDIKFMAP